VIPINSKDGQDADTEALKTLGFTNIPSNLPVIGILMKGPKTPILAGFPQKYVHEKYLKADLISAWAFDQLVQNDIEKAKARLSEQPNNSEFQEKLKWLEDNLPNVTKRHNSLKHRMDIEFAMDEAGAETESERKDFLEKYRKMVEYDGASEKYMEMSDELEGLKDKLENVEKKAEKLAKKKNIPLDERLKTLTEKVKERVALGQDRKMAQREVAAELKKMYESDEL